MVLKNPRKIIQNDLDCFKKRSKRAEKCVGSIKLPRHQKSQPPSVVPNPASSLPRAHNDTMLVGINWISIRSPWKAAIIRLIRYFRNFRRIRWMLVVVEWSLALFEVLVTVCGLHPAGIWVA
ncbi:uncharacterized protein BJ212DRAFT_1304152 [Suillus subaureus]|uniref:Uncharacterized protein n=1 Tax=Suillus subaureus TaxID=48587 RepID=A0A9P7DX42_9AGAM|nr:uncharacterized protein BJ212DRAFT_1304152 [Suillus subaureus]KAG1805193.1 hypothetical protein BJ212DRAFT_1304152 [Suillus subaureus]